MRHLTVALYDEEAVKLEAVARARGIDTTNLTKTDLLKLLSASKFSRWRSSVSARKNRAALIVFPLRPRRKSITKAIPPDSAQETIEAPSAASNAEQQAARARRLAALIPSQGIWKGDQDKPQDGVAYQNEVRCQTASFALLRRSRGG